MRPRYRRTLVAGLGCLYLAGLGFLSGILLERARFDRERSAVLIRLSTMQQALHARLMDMEGRSEEDAPATRR
jgi:hypothetical protein